MYKDFNLFLLPTTATFMFASATTSIARIIRLIVVILGCVVFLSRVRSFVRSLICVPIALR
jgi:Ca2+/Na+ antiporter